MGLTSKQVELRGFDVIVELKYVLNSKGTGES